MTTTTRERFKYKLEEIQSNFLNYNWVHTKEYMYDFLITEPILDIIETIEKEAEERMKEKCLACVPKIEQSVLDSYDEGNSRDDAYQKWCMMESQVIRNSISSL